ncbi:winged helix-turn-helix transcriptional regulator [Dyadobacter endophyticus]|uniref:winged helix-turn-helix transcriptional regulator n=1 Tax=Dyadobacter endophyticus TaxID=1749036 RepID=UPI003CFB03CA
MVLLFSSGNATGSFFDQPFNQFPPLVEYFLTDLGESLKPIFNEMAKWGGKIRILVISIE